MIVEDAVGQAESTEKQPNLLVSKYKKKEQDKIKINKIFLGINVVNGSWSELHFVISL